MLLSSAARNAIGAVCLLLTQYAAGAAAADDPRRLRVAVYDNPPVITYDEYRSRPGGIFVDVLDYAARQHGWSVEYVPGSFTQGLTRLQQGQVDLLAAAPHTSVRQLAVAFAAEPVIGAWGVVYARKGNSIGSLLDLAGKHVAVIEGGVQQGYLDDAMKGATAPALLQPWPTLAAAFRSVARADADAVVAAQFTGRVLARRYGLQATSAVLAPLTFRIAARDESKREVLNAIDESLIQLKADPGSVYYKAFQELARDPDEVPRWIAWAAAGVGCVLLVGLIWGVNVKRASVRISASERDQRRIANELRRIHEYSLDVIAVLDDKFIVRRISRACEALWGMKPEEIVGRSCLELLAGGAVADTLERVRGGAALHALESPVRRCDGSVALMLWSVVWSQEEQEFYAIGRDDTERSALIRGMQLRKAQLRLANQDLRTFAQSVAPDLRSPVAAVSGFVSKVLRDESPVLQERSRDLLSRAHSASKRMDEIIASLLRLARLSARSVERRDCDVTAVCDDIVQQLSGEGRCVAAHVDVQRSMRAWADRELLRHALYNLISNAVKFSAQVEQPRVRVGCEQADTGECVFYVEDNGVGFDMTYASENLFKPFSRMHLATEFEGTGIGLTIVRRIVTGHGGRVWAQAQPGMGAVFRFTLCEPPVHGRAEVVHSKRAATALL